MVLSGEGLFYSKERSKRLGETPHQAHMLLAPAGRAELPPPSAFSDGIAVDVLLLLLEQSNKVEPKEDLASGSALRLGTCSPGPLPSAAYQGKQGNVFNSTAPSLGSGEQLWTESPPSTTAASGSVKL